MENINSVVVSGNLTRDAELRVTQGGMNILSFTVASNERRKNADGGWEDCPNFIDCKMFGKRASALEQYLTKGSKATVCGKLRYSEWESDGKKRSKLEVVASSVEFTTKDGGKREEYASEDLPF